MASVSLVQWLGSHSGVAHTSDARAAGYTGREMSRAVNSGAVNRVRRSWLTTPDCNPARVAAASVSGRVTCVSAAALRGWWDPGDDVQKLVHVAVAGTASRFDRAGLRVHWSAGPAPVGRNANEDTVLNVLFHVARCLERSDALAVWESAIRAEHVDAAVLKRVSWRCDAAAAIAALATDLSDSGVETRFVHLMRGAGVAVRQQVRIDGRPVDGLIGERLLVQIDGFAHHSDAAQRRRDIAADARLALRGYTTLRFDYAQVFFDAETVQTTVLTAIAQGLHRAR